MKALPILFACLAVFAISTFASLSIAADAPGAGVVGRYDAPGQKDTYLDLRPDGACVMSLAGDKESLTYTVKGSVVTLMHPGRPPLVLKLVNGVLSLPDGSGQFVRAGAAAAAAASPAPAPVGAEVAGRYGLPGLTDTYLDLRPDATYTMSISGLKLDSGAYTVKGSAVTLISPNQLQTLYQLDHGILTEAGEAKFVRMDYVAPAPSLRNAGGKAGRYVCPGKLDTHLDIRPDGTFTLMQPGQTISGAYFAKGAEVSLKSPDLQPTTVQIDNGILIGPDRGNWPRVWEAGPPPTAAAITANAVAIDRTRSISKVQHLCISSQVWAEDHQGNFEDDPNQLLAKPYLDNNSAVLHCPLLHDDSQIGYEYYGKGLKWKKGGSQDAILFLSKWHDAEGRRIIGRADSSVEFAVPKMEDLPAAARGSMAASEKPSSGAPPTPNATLRATPAPTAVPPPQGEIITLSLHNTARGRRAGAAFPAEQMPANPQNYFWVVDRPGNGTKVSELHHNEWHFSNLPGLYKIHVEYRSGNVNKTVSNVLEITVPPAGAPVP